MLADGSMGYTYGLSRYMPKEYREEADIVMKALYRNKDSQGNELIEPAAIVDYLEDRIAGEPEMLYYDNDMSIDNNREKKVMVRRLVDLTSSGKDGKNKNWDNIYKDAEGKLQKLPFGGFAQTVIARRKMDDGSKSNRVEIKLKSEINELLFTK